MHGLTRALIFQM